MNTEPTVFIVNDDPVFCESLSDLALSMGLRSKTYASAGDFLENFDQSRPGCLIVDVHMPQLSGLALQENLIKFPLCPPVIVVTGHADVPAALRALKQGAVEVLQKTSSEAELREAVRRAISIDTERRQAYLKREDLLARFALLSPAERQVLDLVLAGYPNKRIASALDVSLRAVEDRRARVRQKLNVDTLPDLVRFAIDAGLEIDKSLQIPRSCA